MKLFKITLVGLGVHYAVAPDATTAYSRVRAWMDKEDYGFRKDRALKSVELIAEADQYAECGTRLWL